ncbi:MAG: hypothetical protein M1823_000415 [Watsoniomyces obsoletus]|nr:MAG: hypothetical protein M1823_000415 [Watsoniomyces obsoletus]
MSRSSSTIRMGSHPPQSPLVLVFQNRPLPKGFTRAVTNLGPEREPEIHFKPRTPEMTNLCSPFRLPHGFIPPRLDGSRDRPIEITSPLPSPRLSNGYTDSLEKSPEISTVMTTPDADMPAEGSIVAMAPHADMPPQLSNGYTDLLERPAEGSTPAMAPHADMPAEVSTVAMAPHADVPPQAFYTTFQSAPPIATPPENEGAAVVNVPAVKRAAKRALAADAAPSGERPKKRARPTVEPTEEVPLVIPDPANMPVLHDDGNKPGYSYSMLIGMAILRAPYRRLTLAQIYQWISDSFVFYRTTGTGWHNSIRHNLSLNGAFVKQERPKSDPGKGNYWVIVPGKEAEFLKQKKHGRGQQKHQQQQPLAGMNPPASMMMMTTNPSMDLMNTTNPSMDPMNMTNPSMYMSGTVPGPPPASVPASVIPPDPSNMSNAPDQSTIESNESLADMVQLASMALMLGYETNAMAGAMGVGYDASAMAEAMMMGGETDAMAYTTMMMGGETDAIAQAMMMGGETNAMAETTTTMMMPPPMSQQQQQPIQQQGPAPASRPTSKKGTSRPTSKKGPSRPTSKKETSRPTSKKGPSRATSKKGPSRPTSNNGTSGPPMMWMSTPTTAPGTVPLPPLPRPATTIHPAQPRARNDLSSDATISAPSDGPTGEMELDRERAPTVTFADPAPVPATTRTMHSSPPAIPSSPTVQSRPPSSRRTPANSGRLCPPASWSQSSKRKLDADMDDSGYFSATVSSTTRPTGMEAAAAVVTLVTDDEDDVDRPRSSTGRAEEELARVVRTAQETPTAQRIKKLTQFMPSTPHANSSKRRRLSPVVAPRGPPDPKPALSDHVAPRPNESEPDPFSMEGLRAYQAKLERRSEMWLEGDDLDAPPYSPAFNLEHELMLHESGEMDMPGDDERYPVAGQSPCPRGRGDILLPSPLGTDSPLKRSSPLNLGRDRKGSDALERSKRARASAVSRAKGTSISGSPLRLSSAHSSISPLRLGSPLKPLTPRRALSKITQPENVLVGRESLLNEDVAEGEPNRASARVTYTDSPPKKAMTPTRNNHPSGGGPDAGGVF